MDSTRIKYLSVSSKVFIISINKISYFNINIYYNYNYLYFEI